MELSGPGLPVIKKEAAAEAMGNAGLGEAGRLAQDSKYRRKLAALLSPDRHPYVTLHYAATNGESLCELMLTSPVV